MVGSKRLLQYSESLKNRPSWGKFPFLQLTQPKIL